MATAAQTKEHSKHKEEMRKTKKLEEKAQNVCADGHGSTKFSLLFVVLL